MYHTFSLRFMVAKSKVDRNGQAALLLSIIINKERTCIQLQKKIKPEEFNSKTQTSSNEDINNYISIVRTRIMEIQTNLFALNISITAQKVKDVYNGAQLNKQWGLIELYEIHNQEMKKLVGKTIVSDSFKKHVYVLNYLRAFMKSIDKPINDINTSFIIGFYNYLISEKGQQHNTAVGCMKKLKKIFNQATNDNLISKNPFFGIKYKLDKVIPTYLSMEEMTKIWEKGFSNKRIEQVRDVYIFNCLTGLSFIDCKNLNKNEIIEDENGNFYIRKPRQKTKVIATIPLSEVAIKILTKYNYSLPVISNQRMNAYLKEIADLCGVNKTLTTHTARHSAATLLLNSGVSINTVSAVLGHSSLKITQHYAKLIDKTVINELKGINLLRNE